MRKRDPERDVRGWLLQHCPALLQRLEEMQEQRAMRLATIGRGYPDGDIEAVERVCWDAIRMVPGYAGLVAMAVKEEEEKDEG